MLLLHLMSHLFPKRIRAIYIDHQLQDVSPQWGSFVQEQCYVLEVPCVIQAVDVDTGNVESQARSARYAAFQKHLLANEILVRPSSTRSSRNRFTPFTLWCGDSWTSRHAGHRYTRAIYNLAPAIGFVQTAN